jgi:hypothetical protein
MFIPRKGAERWPPRHPSSTFQRNPKGGEGGSSRNTNSIYYSAADSAGFQTPLSWLNFHSGRFWLSSLPWPISASFQQSLPIFWLPFRPSGDLSTILVLNKSRLVVDSTDQHLFCSSSRVDFLCIRWARRIHTAKLLWRTQLPTKLRRGSAFELSCTVLLHWLNPNCSKNLELSVQVFVMMVQRTTHALVISQGLKIGWFEQFPLSLSLSFFHMSQIFWSLWAKLCASISEE